MPKFFVVSDVHGFYDEMKNALDEAGFEDCKICGTNSLDEYVITSILEEGAKIDLFGVVLMMKKN